MATPFRDRSDAGTQLGMALAGLELREPVVLGLARGGVVVAAGVAAALGAPLEVLVVRKIGAPFQPELGLGAIAEGGVVRLNRELIDHLGIDEAQIAQIIEDERRELNRRVQMYRGERPPPVLAGKTAVVVDDGLATGGSASAAGLAVREIGCSRSVLAVPVGSSAAATNLSRLYDEVICLLQPPGFRAVGQFYADFSQTTDEEVSALLGE